MIDNRFGFLTNFKKCLHKTGQMLYISSDPKPNERVSEWFQNTVGALEKEGIRFDKCTLVNGHNASMLKEAITQTDVIFLSPK